MSPGPGGALRAGAGAATVDGGARGRGGPRDSADTELPGPEPGPTAGLGVGRSREKGPTPHLAGLQLRPCRNRDEETGARLPQGPWALALRPPAWNPWAPGGPLIRSGGEEG